VDNGNIKFVDKYSVKSDENLSIGEIPEELYNCAKAGADVCPANAIKIEKIEE
ncbi:MAG: ferredoxin, partial [Ignisphaera sp.]|nr:ferredoxin [Ignisphaera sp.]